MGKARRVLVVGGGAAGLIAAVSAARLGANVTILERNARVGKKILATGNGRCNFTNINTDTGCYYGKNKSFIRNALSAFSAVDAIKFFEKLGIQYKVEDEGKAFPMSDQASSFLDVYLYELKVLKVHILCNCFAESICAKQDCLTVKIKGGDTISAESVIIATGGKAMPLSGSDGNGYDLAKDFGHTIAPVFPSLVQIKLEGSFYKRIEGVKFIGTVGVLHNNRSMANGRGDILFTNYGVSGPPVLKVSRKAGELISEGKNAYLKISIIDTMSEEELTSLIKKRFSTGPDRPVDFSFVGLINKRLIPVILKEAGVDDIKRPVKTLSAAEIGKIINVLMDWKLRIRGTKGWQSAQVTAGGVITDEICPYTMESKLVKGLYFAGEIMDVDGLCGGFNLQWAWTSGFIAGQNAAVKGSL